MATRSRSAGDPRPAKPRRARPAFAKPRLLQGAVVGVVGAGQIGGSIIRRLSGLRPDLTVCAFDLDTSLAAKLRPFARVCRTLDDLVGRSDVVVLAVPVHTAVRLMPRIARLAGQRISRRKLIVCDTSTVKAATIASAARHPAAFDFVGLHPLAGTEGQGWESANAKLYDGRPVVICPARPRAGRVAREFITLLGGTPARMNARDHDRLVAEGIGLPHILAFAAAGMGARQREGSLLRGGSWRSLTRVAASSPAMVAGFLHENREHQLRLLARFQRQLNTVARVLRQPSTRRLERLLSAWHRRASETGSGSHRAMKG